VSLNSPASRKRRKKVLNTPRAISATKSKLFRYAKEAVQHAWQYAYRDRRKKKAIWRSLWIVRLNAACRAAGLSYNRFIEGLPRRQYRARPQGPCGYCRARRSRFLTPWSHKLRTR